MLLVWGRDSFIPAEAVGRMKVMKGNLTVVEVEGANHFVPVSHPEETIRVVKSFLEVG
jgi:pimeloyl-ACP methyl ester carboxylesterase